MQLYVVNLDRCPERLAHFQAQFDCASLDFVRVAAVDSRQLDDEQYRSYQALNIWDEPLTRGEVACFLSHAKALKQLVADNVPYGVIFEDDIVLGFGAKDILRSADWLIEISGMAGVGMVDVVKLETAGKKLWLGQHLPLHGAGLEAFGLARIKSTHIMAAAYLISQGAAIRLLDLMQHKIAPFDHFLFNFSLGVAQNFSLYQLDPAIAVQANSVSTLEGERVEKKKQERDARHPLQTLVRELLRIMRRCRTGIWGLKTNFFTDERWKRVSCIKNGG